VFNAEISLRLAEMDLAELLEPATQSELQQARARLLQAEQTLSDLLAGASEAEIANAEALLAQAEERLVELESGASEDEIELSEGNVRQADLNLLSAQATLDAAQQDLEDTTLYAPVDGTVIAVSAEAGERVGSDAQTLITLASLSQPLLEVFVDESDMDKIAVGYEVEVELDAIPDELFTGRVIQVDPTLVREDNVDVFRGIVALDPDSFAKPQGLPLGLHATVDIIGGRAENAVLIPVEALRELDPGEYAVFVVENGKPKMRLVEVGLMDVTYAEIRTGIEAGDTVSTGIVETR
jgi:RND family efflux transporter MFP subunit